MHFIANEIPISNIEQEEVLCLRKKQRKKKMNNNSKFVKCSQKLYNVMLNFSPFVYKTALFPYHRK